MSDQIVTHLQTCKCQHDRASHFEETVCLFTARAGQKAGDKVRRACLCRGCDCAEYAEPRD